MADDLTGKVRLVRPSEQYLESYLEACKEFKAAHVQYASVHDPDAFHDWRDTIFAGLANSERGIGLKEGYVPSTTFWLVDGSDYVGTGNIRHRLTPALEEFGGHIGYLIRPSRWNLGYGTVQLRYLLREACKLGIDPALITCDLDNPASARVMVKNGARLIDTTKRVIDGAQRTICRFEVPTCRG
jgi:predicted acetyltransferase